jgi:hypothetical protein
VLYSIIHTVQYIPYISPTQYSYFTAIKIRKQTNMLVQLLNTDYLTFLKTNDALKILLLLNYFLNIPTYFSSDLHKKAA